MTDTLVLKNAKFTKGLVMPKKGTYLELEQDEMEYVDGGCSPIQIAGVAGWVVSVACKIALWINEGYNLRWHWGVVLGLKITAAVGIALSIFSGVQQLFTNGVMKNVMTNILTKWVKLSAQKANWVWGIIKGVSLGNSVRSIIYG